MTTPTKSIEVVQNLVLDTIEPFIKRLADLEQTVLDFATTPMPADPQVAALADTVVKVVEHASVENEALQARLDAVIALHKIEAKPAQWIFAGGKQEAAPDGLWEITCSGCTWTTTWTRGDPDPEGCRTVRAARG